MYTASNLSLHIGKRPVLNDVSLMLEPGKFTAVVGANGAGKSTLLRLLANELKPTAGQVSINGKPIQSYAARELSKVRAVLPQHSQVPFAFSVEQIVRLGRHAHRTMSTVDDAIINEVMALAGVDDFRGRTYLTLSGGEKQRVQFARVLAQVWDETVYPRYILLDEPTASLDIAQQQHIFSVARQVRERNIGVLAIVHDLNQAVQFADHLYFLKEGKVVAAGEARDVFTKSNIEETFCCRVNLYHDPCNNCPYIIPERPSLHAHTHADFPLNGSSDFQNLKLV